MDPAEHVRKLRKDYERALDAAESRRVAYHEAVLDLIDRGGPPLREFAEELGLSHERVHEIVSRPPRRRRRSLGRALGAVGAVFVLLAATLGGLWLVQAPPFVPSVQVPRVLQMREATAVGRVKEAGLHPRVVYLRRNIPLSLSHYVLGVSNAPSERIAKGSTITLYVAIANGVASPSKTHS